ncbi:hypothetical protein [Holdemania sp. Marseille-P2844]|nr:hypothetical protein [Holdemania sp. Marseille-P2844]
MNFLTFPNIFNFKLDSAMPNKGGLVRNPGREPDRQLIVSLSEGELLNQ